MFKKNKCARCGKTVAKDFGFCPSCGSKLGEGEKGDYGMLGKNDFDESEVKLPFGLGAMIRPLMRELTRQMSELDKELKQDAKPQGKDMKRTGFSLHFSTPGQKPIKIETGTPVSQLSKPVRKVLRLPKISSSLSKKFKKLKKVEPDANVRRLSNTVVYELGLPGVESLTEINISQLENAIEVKAMSDNCAYEKEIDIDLPLVNYNFEDSLLVLEFGLK
ncbi:MAG: hypothetical protein U9Q06_02515 [Nanoarchaeota archaeon]|nr:hypothetical protein [Nanoarchaeota archaeon]